jgi:hypothetical protein
MSYEKAGEIPVTHEMAKEGGIAVADYSVSLFNGNNPHGSGTLVSLGNIKGILTADHVWQHLLTGVEKNSFGMAIKGVPHRITYPIAGCTATVIGMYSDLHAATGPDLTFIRLCDSNLNSTIGAGKSWFPIKDDGFEIFDRSPFDKIQGYISGAPVELVSVTGSGTPSTAFRVPHLIVTGNFTNHREHDGFDYLDFDVPAGTGIYPESYGGASGGGCWLMYQNALDPEGHQRGPIRVHLVGVIFYESALHTANSTRTLLLHGPRSIYHNLIRQMRAQYPEEVGKASQG